MEYTKAHDAAEIDDGWTIRDEDGETIAILQTERLADVVLKGLRDDGSSLSDAIDEFKRLCEAFRVVLKLIQESIE